jgi:hypothetical protein
MLPRNGFPCTNGVLHLNHEFINFANGPHVPLRPCLPKLCIRNLRRSNVSPLGSVRYSMRPSYRGSAKEGGFRRAPESQRSSVRRGDCMTGEETCEIGPHLATIQSRQRDVNENLGHGYTPNAGASRQASHFRKGFRRKCHSSLTSHASVRIPALRWGTAPGSMRSPQVIIGEPVFVGVGSAHQ